MTHSTTPSQTPNPAGLPQGQPRYVLALDQGTSSSRAILFDHFGNVVRLAQREFRQYYPHPGHVEHDPYEIWQSQLAVAHEVLNDAGVSASQLHAIGITNQRETTVLWDRATGEPVGRALVWQDRRTAPMCEALVASGHGELFRERTGLIVDAYFSGTKLRWMLDHIEGARARAERGELAFGTVDAWLVWQLTDGARHVTDVSNASRTMLFNIHRFAWDDELLALLDIPRSVLPEVVPSSGEVARTASRLFGAEVPIAGIAGDQQAATFGQACLSPGMAKNTYGTGCFLLMNTGSQPVTSHNRLLTTVGWRFGERTVYCLEGGVFMGGATIQWLRDGLQIIRSAAEVEPLARQCEDTGGVVLVPAFAGLGAPHWDAFARGTLVGMTRGTGRPQIARAALESIALQSVDVLDAMQKDAGISLAELRVDGGASRSDLLMQMQADLLGTTVVRPRVTETTALGAAYLAGLATGYWQDEGEISRQWQVEQRFEPRLSADARAQHLARWHRAVDRARDWAREDLADGAP
ncbi:glycerol kinase GlpK [Cupriavidus malaysiensis]|uniref:Glycerol kinase n=1 Tax=Cupriavidus malaysiensis TaxID=367825 RepID=A0ABM6F684_9BURK|nr:glycerol kinase GlpK [Cupriavidus malaysiensis]AOZ07035.1 glycerol kinase [Cupriavidus malaysiensis]